MTATAAVRNDLSDLLFPKEEKKCLICYCPLSIFNSQKFNRNCVDSFLLNGQKRFRTGSQAKTIINKQLHIIFILKTVLELPSSQLEKYLRHAGDPENWIRLCDACSDEVERVKVIYKELQRLTARFEEAKWLMQEKIIATSEKYQPQNKSMEVKDDDEWMSFPSPTNVPLVSGRKRGGRGGRRGKKFGGVTADFFSPPGYKEFDIAETCRSIVSQRSDNPPPLTLSTNPFFSGDKAARRMAGFEDEEEGPDVADTMNNEIPILVHCTASLASPVEAATTAKTVSENVLMVAEPERAMRAVVKYEVEVGSNDELECEEPDFGYDGLPLTDSIDEDNFEGIVLETMNGVNSNPVTIPEEFKVSIPCPLCAKHSLRFARMGSACRHLQSCLNTYDGRTRYLRCPLCKKWKCRVKEISLFAEHLQMCRDGLGSCETTPSLEQRIFSCNICKDVEAQYMQYDEFLKHLYRYHQHSYGCTKCPARFETLQDCTVEHWKKRHEDCEDKTPILCRFKMDCPELPEIPWWCPMCFQQFPNENTRDSHVDSCPEIEFQMEAERSFKCKTCPKTYFWEEELKIHDVITHAKPHHLNIKPYFCDQCMKYFQTEERLKTHSVTLSLSHWLYKTTKKFNLLTN